MLMPVTEILENAFPRPLEGPKKFFRGCVAQEFFHKIMSTNSNAAPPPLSAVIQPLLNVKIIRNK